MSMVWSPFLPEDSATKDWEHIQSHRKNTPCAGQGEQGPSDFRHPGCRGEAQDGTKLSVIMTDRGPKTQGSQ